MGFLPEDPRDQKLILGLIAPVALGVLFFLYVYRPKAEELAQLDERIEDLTAQNQTARDRMSDLERLRTDLARAERRFAVLERLVPTGSEVPAIYQAIASESEALDLDLLNVVPNDAQTDSDGYFLRQNWEMEIEGSYHDVGRFLSRVASFDRIVRPQVREIRPVGEADPRQQSVSVLFDLETFVLPPPGTAATDDNATDESADES